MINAILKIHTQGRDEKEEKCIERVLAVVVMVCGVVNVNLTLAYFIFLQSDENFT
jgi:heme/copper-type cytochrome/quinol oxidase subunit 4